MRCCPAQSAARLLGLLACCVWWSHMPMLRAAENVAPARPARPAWTSSTVKGTPEPPPPLRARPFYEHVRFKNPTSLTTAPGSDRFFVTELYGGIYSIPKKPVCPQADPFIDIHAILARLNEHAAEPLRFGAVFGLTFHPDFATNRFCYLCYTVGYKDESCGAYANGTRVVRLTVTEENGVPRCDPASEVEIITWPAGGHNGGCLRFGPDGCLYISAGDGGDHFPADIYKTGQDVTDLRASIMRIDVDHPSDGRAYSIPKDNPLLSVSGARGEIFAYGLRNVWKMSFDRKAGDLWAGDVGLETWELVCRVRSGDNFGWSIQEGRNPVHPDWPRGPTPIVPPTIEVPHTVGASITGGVVYRGSRFPELAGSYVFGDWETRRLWGVTVDTSEPGPLRDLAAPTVRVIDFAEDHDGELYLLDYDDGSIQELVRNETSGEATPFPTTLSATGLFADTSHQTPASGVLCFDIQAEAWADHATARRFVGVPGDGQIEFYSPSRQVPGSMFSRTLFVPAHTVFAKTFFMEMERGKPETSRPIETQLLHFDGSHWHGYTYAWNDAGTDADLVAPEGKQLPLVIKDAAAPGGVRTQTWRFFGRNECLRCHNAWAETTLAFTVPQLNRDIVVDGVHVNQLQSFRDSRFIKDMVVEPNLDDNPFATVARPGPTESLPRLADPADISASLEARARSYLHVNCASCHRFGGGSVPHLHLNIDLPLGDVKAVGMQPSQGGFGIPSPQVIAAGDPFRSTLLYRMSTVGPGRMPHIGSEIVDDRGLALIHDWIARLPTNFADVQLVERLIALDEATVTERESREAPQQRWKMAKHIASEDGRKQPNDSDLAMAEEERLRQAADRGRGRREERARLADELLSSTSRAVMLAGALRKGRLPPAIQAQVVAAAQRHPEAVIAGLFEEFVPADQRVKRLGTVVDPATILALSGDASRGRRLYHEAASMQCRNCHMIGDAGREVGPPLTVIGGKLDRAKLLESMLEPSKTIDPKYQSWVVETADGRALNGLVVSKTGQSVVLRDAENKTVELPTAEIEQMEPQKVSLMPEHLLRDLTASEAADLLAYLESLR
jgi:putative heme-binding domain-containing protein